MELVSRDADRVFARLCAENGQMLLALALLRLGDRQEAEDLVQDVLFEFLRNLRAGKIERNPRACLFGLLEFRARDCLRSRGRRGTMLPLSSGEDDEGDDLAARLPGPDRVEERGLVRAALSIGLAGLTDPERTLLAGVVVEKTIEELATEFAMPKERMKKWRQRLLKKLRPCFSAPVCERAVSNAEGGG